ncbi:hypothetical protein SDC9_44044 [bioreactor metagenome]|uniref:Flagellar protein n=1 Tax=bioreactor metagenome TaxID=1076179 RepID=A0A644W297_9ZZZZ
MGLKNCPECGRLFVENASGLCPACYEQVEADEVKVVDYLRDARKATLQEIHDITGVKENIIMRMLRRGRILSDFAVSYPCETCGELITEGRLCSRCSKGFTDQIKKPAEPAWNASDRKESQKTHERMYSNKIR